MVCGAGAVLVGAGGVSAGIGPVGMGLNGARASRSRMLPAEALRFLIAAGALARGTPAERYRCPRGRLGHEPLTARYGDDHTGQPQTRPHRDRTKSRGGRNADPSEQNTDPHRCCGGWRFADQDAFTSGSLNS